MNVKVYARRATKSILYIAVIFFLVFGVMFLFGEKKDPNISFFDLTLPAKNRLPMIGFIVVFGLAYPFLTFSKKTVYLNKPFNEERDEILKIFNTSEYIVVGEGDNKFFFRPASSVRRFMRMMEDTVELDYSDNPIILSGMRKDVYRLSRHIEYNTMKNGIEQ